MNRSQAGGGEKMASSITTTHMKTLESFIVKLNEAARDIIKASCVYHRVACLVTYWPDSDQPHLKTQGKNLWDVFKDVYGFEVGAEPFELPSGQPYRHLSKAIYDIVFEGGISSENQANLFILYYGGHATEDALWQPTVKSKVALDWGSCQNLLTEAECDVLFLFDCCYGGAMVDSRRSWKRRCEMLCSTPPSHEASAKEDESFTKALVGELRNEYKTHNGCDIITLHSVLNSARSRDTYNLAQDPWFWMPFSVTRARPGIVLHSMKRDEGAPHLTLAERQSLSDARMLFKIAFANPRNRPLLDEWKHFLRNRPSNILDLEFSVYAESRTRSTTTPALDSQQAAAAGLINSQTELHATFDSHSNTAIMSVPLWLWSLLDPHPAIQAITVVRSLNLMERKEPDRRPAGCSKTPMMTPASRHDAKDETSKVPAVVRGGQQLRAMTEEAVKAAARVQQPGRSGLQNLIDLVGDLRQINGLGRNKYPIVLVAGFGSFGDPLFGSVNYWGGFEDLASSLQAHTGVPVILPRIGPFSSNWERACELYCQLYNIQRAGLGTGFDTRATSPATRIPVDYGQYITLPTPPPHFTKQAVLLGVLPANWQWGVAHPVHMICHSQGGNTVRLLIELLSGNHWLQNPRYFYFSAPGNRQNFVRSVATLGTPYRGSTITNVILDEVLRDVQVDEVISRLVVSASRNPSSFVDLQLDHWGFKPLPEPLQETFLEMRYRLKDDICRWWTSDNNAVKDNGIQGIARLNADFSPRGSASTYYFTMSFDATRPLPKFNIAEQEVRSVPVNPFLSLGGLLYPGPGNIIAGLATSLLEIGHNLPGNPSDVAYARWAVGVINNRLRDLGYQIRLPSPGGRIPRGDMLPVLSIFSIGMSGMSESSGLSEQNDGVVDTSSMRAPANETVRDINTFDRNAIQTNRGVYWDLGLTEGIDHADQVGVFTVSDTYKQVLQIYQQLGDLLSALP